MYCHWISFMASCSHLQGTHLSLFLWLNFPPKFIAFQFFSFYQHNFTTEMLLGSPSSPFCISKRLILLFRGYFLASWDSFQNLVCKDAGWRELSFSVFPSKPKWKPTQKPTNQSSLHLLLITIHFEDTTRKSLSLTPSFSGQPTADLG